MTGNHPGEGWSGRRPSGERPTVREMLHRPAVLSDPTDVIAAVPHLLGFHPRDTLVILAERNRRVYLAAWMVIPAPGREDTARETLQPVLTQGVPDSVCLMGWESAPGTAVRAVLTVASVVHELGLRLRPPLVVSPTGWEVLEDPSGLPGGHPLPAPHHPMAVRFLVDTAAGVQVIEVCGEHGHR